MSQLGLPPTGYRTNECEAIVSTATINRDVPAAATTTHRRAAIEGAVSLITSATVLAGAIMTDLNSDSRRAFVGGAILIVATLFAIVGMIAPVERSNLDKNGSPIVRLLFPGIPGAVWTYISHDGQTLEIIHTHTKTCDYRTVTVWRSLRLMWVRTSLVLGFVGSVIVGGAALDAANIDLSVQYVLL